jgi:Xaa-Pro aminopeptidase
LVLKLNKGKVVSEEMEEKFLRHKQEINNLLQAILIDFDNHRGKLDSFEAATLDNFKRQESQRDAHNSKMEAKMSQLSEWFDSHNINEMEKYDMIISELRKLSENYEIVKIETDDNTSLLRQKRIEEEKDRAVKEAIDNVNKPYKEMRNNIILTAITVITGAVVVGIWKLIMFVGDIDNLVKGAM